MRWSLTEIITDCNIHAIYIASEPLALVFLMLKSVYLFPSLYSPSDWSGELPEAERGRFALLATWAARAHTCRVRVVAYGVRTATATHSKHWGGHAPVTDRERGAGTRLQSARGVVPRIGSMQESPRGVHTRQSHRRAERSRHVGWAGERETFELCQLFSGGKEDLFAEQMCH